ncbi:hypothetical protein [Thermococcus sp. JCM 11816]|uniref:hypothetical protein n=1 Tax=Thermococcus sp. (strain JCM 11816 / KS-1) TaxID=1295125 RepID=UPI0006D15193
MKALRIVGVILIVLGLITAGYGFSYKAQAAQKEKVWEDFVSGENYNLKPLVLNVSEDKTVAGFFVFYKVSPPAYWYYNGSLSIDFGEVLNRLPPTRAKPLNNPEELVRKTHIYDLIDNPENRDIFISYHITRIPDLVEIYYNDNNFIDDYGYCNGMNKDAYIVATIHGHTYFLFPEDKIGYADVIGDAKETDREYENKPFIVFYDGGLVAGYLKDPRNYDLYIQFGVPIIVADGFELPKGYTLGTGLTTGTW